MPWPASAISKVDGSCDRFTNVARAEETDEEPIRGEEIRLNVVQVLEEATHWR